MRLRLFRFLLLILTLTVLAACRPSSTPTPAPSIPPILSEEALLQTSVAQVTQAAFETLDFLPTSTATSTATPLPQITQIPTIARSATPEPTPTNDLPCNKAGAGVPFDITIPDDSPMYAGQEFIKTWRLVNRGSCKWTRLYKLVFFSQNSMSAQQEQFLSGEVLPGQAIDLSVKFYAPLAPGSYQSNWMLQDPDGNLFGIGFNADAPFYVKIIVTNDPTPTPTITPTPTSTP
jgi:hypothetical protein